MSSSERDGGDEESLIFCPFGMMTQAVQQIAPKMTPASEWDDPLRT